MKLLTDISCTKQFSLRIRYFDTSKLGEDFLQVVSMAELTGESPVKTLLDRYPRKF